MRPITLLGNDGRACRPNSIVDALQVTRPGLKHYVLTLRNIIGQAAEAESQRTGQVVLSSSSGCFLQKVVVLPDPVWYFSICKPSRSPSLPVRAQIPCPTSPSLRSYLDLLGQH